MEVGKYYNVVPIANNWSNQPKPEWFWTDNKPTVRKCYVKSKTVKNTPFMFMLIKVV